MTADRIADLTVQERACLRGFWKHGSVAAIAIEEGRSISTIEKHLHSARRKLRVNRSIDGARLLAIAEGRDRYGPPSRSVTSADHGHTDSAFPTGADHQFGAAVVRDAGASSHWQAPVAAIDEIVGMTPWRVVLTPGQRLVTIGRRAAGTVSAFATLLLVAYVLQRLARGE